MGISIKNGKQMFLHIVHTLSYKLNIDFTYDHKSGTSLTLLLSNMNIKFKTADI